MFDVMRDRLNDAGSLLPHLLARSRYTKGGDSKFRFSDETRDKLQNIKENQKLGRRRNVYFKKAINVHDCVTLVESSMGIYCLPLALSLSPSLCLSRLEKSFSASLPLTIFHLLSTTHETPCFSFIAFHMTDR